MHDSPPVHILITDDREDFLNIISGDLARKGYIIETAETPAAARIVAAQHEIDLFIVDLYIPDLSDGLALITDLRKAYRDVPILTISATEKIDDAVQALKCGASDFLQKPFAPPRLFVTVESLLERRALQRENRFLHDLSRTQSGLIGRSAVMDNLWSAIQKAAQVDRPVLIVGESGTGKDLAARAIHQLSARAGAPFEVLNCADRDSSLVDDELFGHERGAFTGAYEKRLGLFDQTAHGTLLLDEIGDLPLHMQGKLLQVLETGLYRRVGGEKAIQSSARLIAATHRDLALMAKQGTFRTDLLYRMNVIEIRVPSLRERGDDRRLLALHFLERARLELGFERLEFEPATLAHLTAMEYAENNVRELEHLVFRLALAAGGETIAFTSVSEVQANGSPAPDSEQLASATREFEKGFIRARLAACHGRISRTAESLGISRVQLWRKMNELGLSTHIGND